jgi:hypothetical protein
MSKKQKIFWIGIDLAVITILFVACLNPQIKIILNNLIFPFY